MSIGRVPGNTGIQPSIVDAKGDLIVATAADSVSRLAVGTNGYALLADSAEATGVKWGAVGKVLQVVHGSTTTSTTISTTTFTDSTITATITPSSTSSKIAIFANVMLQMQESAQGANGADARLMRGATQIAGYNGTPDGRFLGMSFTSSNMTYGSIWTSGSIVWLDSPSTTSATTYKIQGALNTTTNSRSMTFQFSNATSSILLMEIGA